MIYNLLQKINPFNYFYAEQAQTIQQDALHEAVHIETEYFKFHLNLLNTSKLPNIPQNLLNHISLKDLKSVFDCILDIIERHKQDFIKLSPGRSIRLKKSQSLPRTCTILRCLNHEFMLFVHTKNIHVDGFKKETAQEQGTFKSVTSTWRIDKGFCEYIKLNADYDQRLFSWQKFLNLANNECRLSQMVKSKYIVANHLAYCPDYADKKRRLAFFGIKASYNLAHFIYKTHSEKEERERLIPDILLGLKLIHDACVIHRDIKPENIVIKRIDGNWVAQYIDFGLSVQIFFSGNEVCGTPYYFSPEIVHACGLYNFSQKQREGLLAAVDEIGGDDEAFESLTDFKNDIWALGIVIFELKHGRRPVPAQDWGVIKEDPLLAGMLAPKRKARFDIDQAIACYNQFNPNRKIQFNEKEIEALKPKVDDKHPFEFNELIMVLNDYESEYCRDKKAIQLKNNL